MRRVAIALVLAGLAGCSRSYVKKEPWPEPTPLHYRTADSAYQPTSLWSDQSPLAGSARDHRAYQVGDLVTVLVVETSEARREAATDVSRSTSVDAGVSAFLGAPTHLGLDKLYGSTGFDPSVKASTSNAFKGKGATNQKDVLKMSVTARVVEVLGDGNLVVEGRRQVKVNNDTQYLYVRGIVRPRDVSANNTIRSTALADAQIQYEGDGLVASQQRPGWMYRVLDAVWPF